MKIILPGLNEEPKTVTGDATKWDSGVYADSLDPLEPVIAVWNGEVRWLKIFTRDKSDCTVKGKYIRIDGYTGRVESITMEREG